MSDKKVLLHICCAPCACFPVRDLRKKEYDVTGFWYNPNIHPFEEYRLRKLTLMDYEKKENVPIIYEDFFDYEYWLNYTHEGWSQHNKTRRCTLCYEDRLNKTAQKAKEEGFDFFTSTLLYSKYQNHDVMISLAKIAEKKYGIPFLYSDFRTGWKEGIKISKELGLYRQRYCGCIFSLQER